VKRLNTWTVLRVIFLQPALPRCCFPFPAFLLYCELTRPKGSKRGSMSGEFGVWNGKDMRRKQGCITSKSQSIVILSRKSVAMQQNLLEITV
jgi:hypothetical protein